MEIEQLSYKWEQLRLERELVNHLQGIARLKLELFDLYLRIQLLLLHGGHAAPSDIYRSSAAKNLESHLTLPNYAPEEHATEEFLKQVDVGTPQLFPANVDTSKEMLIPSSACHELLKDDVEEWSRRWTWIDR
jgi:hypothetical protein